MNRFHFCFALSSHQNPSAEDGGGSAGSGGYVPSEASEAGDDDTDGDTDSDESSDAEDESFFRCERCDQDLCRDDLEECAMYNQLYCRDCEKDLSPGEEVS